MTCQNCHQSTDVRSYKRFIGTRLATLCGACAASLQAIGMALALVEDRRVTDLTPIVERRQPTWLSRLSAKDMTGHAA